jgi:signal transduction histidine kinase
LGVEWLSFWKDEHYEAARNSIEIAKNGGVGRFTGLAPTFSGNRKWWDVVCSPIRDNEGQVERILCVSRDVTEHKRREEEQIKYQEQLGKAVRVRDDFLSIASHELKTPLTSLKLQLQMSKRWFKSEIGPQTTEKLKRTIDVSNTQVNRLQTLIDDLLDVSRIGAGKLQFHFEQVELSKLIIEVVERHNEAITLANSKVELSAPSPVWVWCDQFRIEQVVTNLVSNAAKYGDGKPISIGVEGTPKFAKIVVRDHGMGIAKEKQDKIFERYERAIDANNISGLGLGLYISREIVKAHEGTISVDSDLGQGATFTVELPYHSEEWAIARENCPSNGAESLLIAPPHNEPKSALP